MTDSPSKKSFLLRISDELHTEIKAAADKSSVSMSAWITKAIRFRLDTEGSLNTLEAEYLVKMGDPGICVDGAETKPCPDCGNHDFRFSEGNVTCLLCGRTRIKRPPDYSPQVDGDGMVKVAYKIRDKDGHKLEVSKDRWWE